MNNAIRSSTTQSCYDRVVAAEPAGAPSAEWLSSALGSAVEPVHVEPLGDGVGLLATLTRVELADGRRLVVKQPSTDATNHHIARYFGYYAREAGVYHSLLPRDGIVTPHCHAVVDGASGPSLILDDLAGYQPGDQLVGATARQALAAVDLLARIHAAFWNDPVLAVCDWLPGPTDEVIAGYRRLFALTWDEFRARMAREIQDDQLAAAEEAIAQFDAVCSHFANAPRTLVHGDFRLDNLLFAPDGRAAALDWQLAAWGRGIYDLALFLAGSVEPDLRRALEPALIERYHANLVAAGIDDYPLAACWRDYRLGHVLNLPNPVTALVAVSGGNERGVAMLRANARRALAAVADHLPSVSFA